MLMVVPGGDLERVAHSSFIRRKLPNNNDTGGRNSLLGRQSGGSSLLKMGKDHSHNQNNLTKKLRESETVECRMQEATAATSMDSPEKGRLNEKRIMGRGNVQAKS